MTNPLTMPPCARRRRATCSSRPSGRGGCALNLRGKCRPASRVSRRAAGIHGPTGKKGAQLRPWMAHVRKVAAAHPELTYKAILRRAARGYHPKKKASSPVVRRYNLRSRK